VQVTIWAGGGLCGIGPDWGMPSRHLGAGGQQIVEPSQGADEQMSRQTHLHAIISSGKHIPEAGCTPQTNRGAKCQARTCSW